MVGRARRDGDRLPVRPARAAHPRRQPRGRHLRPRLRGAPAGLQQQLLHRERPRAAHRPVAVRLADRPGRAPPQLRGASASAFLVVAHSRSPTCAAAAAGRRLLAVRTNERAAAAIGVNVFEAKLYGVHALGRHRRARRRAARLRLRRDPLPTASSSPGASISVLVLTVIGSAGYLAGPMLGSLLASERAGHADLVERRRSTPRSRTPRRWQQYLPIATGVLLLVVLILNQNGVAERVDALTRRLPVAGPRAAAGRARAAAGRGPYAGPGPDPRGVRADPAVRRLHRARGRRAAGRARRGGRPARPERRRQDHADRLRGRQQPAHRRLDHLGRPRTSPTGRRTAGPGPGSRARSSRSSSSTTSPCGRTCSPPPTRATGWPT